MSSDLNKPRRLAKPAEALVWVAAVGASALFALGVYSLAGRGFTTTIDDPLALPVELVKTSSDANIPLPPELAPKTQTEAPAPVAAEAPVEQAPAPVVSNPAEAASAGAVAGSTASPAPTSSNNTPAAAAPAPTPAPTTQAPTTAAPSTTPPETSAPQSNKQTTKNNPLTLTPGQIVDPTGKIGLKDVNG